MPRMHNNTDSLLDLFKNEVAKTDAYQILASDNGTLFTNTGATGAVVFTLPALANGYVFDFMVIADYDVTISSSEGSNIVTDNNASASSVAFTTSGQKIGSRLRLYSNLAGTKWYIDDRSTGGTSATEGVTPGTVTASKAVVVDANKDIASFRDMTVRNLDAGASGTAGTVDIFPTTASRGKLQLAVANQTGDTTVTVTAAAMAAARAITLPDPLATADIMLSATQTALGEVKRLPLTSGRNGTYTVLDATGSSTTFKLQGTVGTATNLATAAVQNTTNTCLALFEVVLPPQYRAGQNLTLTVSVHRVVASGTSLTTTIDAEVWLMADAGTAGTDICATSVVTYTDTAAAEKTFTITGTTLAAGSRLLLRLTGVVTEAGNAGTVQGIINSVRLT